MAAPIRLNADEKRALRDARCDSAIAQDGTLDLDSPDGDYALSIVTKMRLAAMDRIHNRRWGS